MGARWARDATDCVLDKPSPAALWLLAAYVFVVLTITAGVLM
jgi:hypothetical protein